jgi:TatD DNase family protein
VLKLKQLPGKKRRMELVDSHTHLDFPEFDPDRAQVIERAWQEGVRLIVNIGTDLNSSQASIALAESYPFIYASIGLHPHDARLLDGETSQALEKLAHHPKVVAIGETGLDYYRNLSPKEAQREAFAFHLELARKLGKPLVIHSREAHQDTLNFLRDFARNPGKLSPPYGIMHCFSGSLEMAKEAIALGFFISVAGPITFQNARKLPAIVKEVPIDFLLIETDCPYLAPHPHRGKRNEPAYVRFVAEAVAEIKGLSLEELGKKMLENAFKVFRLD